MRVKKLIPSFVFSFYHLTLAVLGCLLYGFPSRKLVVIGITGTDGKSSVVELVSEVLSSAGYKVGSVSSIQFRVGRKMWLNRLKMTMPGRFKLQKLLRRMVKADCHYAVLEVTSEGIKQYRHWGINFDVAVLTNLTAEHIESHGSFEKYREAKAKLFKAATPKKISIVNLDDENAGYFLGFKADKKYGYTMNSKQRTVNNKSLFIVHCSLLSATRKGIKFTVNGIDFNLSLLGKFNAYNALAAICVGLSQGISLEVIKSTLEKVKGIPGRMELIDEGQDFTVIVDYAHTPAALEKVYQTVKGSKLISVLGAAGGGRDKWKRPIFGEIVAKYCKHIILTTEDPYDEDPINIINEIAEGITCGRVYKIPKRREAIRKALNLARPDDIVIITGKGCEVWIIVDGEKIAWDDREVVREELRRLETKK